MARTMANLIKLLVFDQAEISHEYKEAGRYIVQLTGVVNGFGFSDLTGALPKARPSREQIVDISQWGLSGSESSKTSIHRVC